MLKKYLNGNALKFNIDFNPQLPKALSSIPNISLSSTSLTPPSIPNPVDKFKFLNTDVRAKHYLGQLGSELINYGSQVLSDGLFGDDSEVGRAVGGAMSGTLGSVGNTLLDNFIKGNTLYEGLGKNAISGASGALGGLAASQVGKGITSIMGDSKLGRFSGGAASSALGQILGGGVGNPINFASNALGAGLSAMTGPSKEYGGKYGNVTQTMDAIYGTALGVVGMMGPVGAAISAGMALNKGLSNIFGSTSGMTKQDAILGSAFMPAPVKWLNMAGARTTDTFKNLSWQNSEKTSTFMQNAFGNLQAKLDDARDKAGKTYGTFSGGAYRDAQNSIDFANDAYSTLLAMADLNELQKIRSLYMTSINNLRYAQNIQGGWSPLAIGKQGMKILNNATNHNMGMRLLSAAALIDNKQMILSAQGGTKLYKPNIFKVTDGTGATRYIYRETPDSEEITVRPLSTIFPNPAEWTFIDDNGKFYTPRNVSQRVTAELNPDGRNALDRFVDNYIGEATNTIPKGYHTLPAIGAAAFGLASPALGEAALTSAFAGHGLSKAVNGEIDGPIDGAITALELAPLGRLAKPVYEGVVQPSMRLFNSPLTGNWAKIGSREYRLSPNGLGANGSPLESRGIAPQITAENAARITPEQWTAAQDAAIAKGDMIEAQRLRDLHFKVSAPNTQIIDKNGNPIHSYHGTGKRFNEFDTTGKYSTLDEGYYGVGAYFAPNKELAQMYADTERTPVVYDTYLNIKNPLRHVRDENADLYGKAIVNNDGVISKLPDDLVDETFDMTEYVATKPNQIKLADAVTYDNNGVRIPLGERDNFKLNDIRYYESPNKKAMKGVKYIEQPPSATSLDAEQQLAKRLESYTPKVGENGLIEYKPLNSGDIINIPEEAVEKQIQRFVDSGITRESAIEYLREQFGYGAMTQNGKTFLLPEKYMITNPEYMKAHDAVHRVLRFDDSFSIPGAEGLNPNEAIAMISGEIKPALGIQANEPLTEEMLNKWLTTTNNKITGRYGFSSKIKDKKKFLEWVNKVAPVMLPLLLGGTAAATLYNK